MGKIQVYMLPDYVRVNGLTGELIEKNVAPIEKSRQIALTSAKNQAVSFQIIVQPESGVLSNVSVKCKDKNTEFFIEWFHRLNDKLIPDCLIPFAPGGKAFTIPLDKEYMPDQKVGAFWVDIWVPTNAQSGLTEQEIELHADGEVVILKVLLDVKDFTVPNESRIVADLNNYADAISPAFSHLANNPNRYTDGSYLKTEQQFFRMAREHKCIFHNLPYKHSGAMPPTFAPELEGEGKYIKVKSWEAFDEHFGAYLDGTAFKDCRFGEHPLEFLYLPFHLGWPSSYEKWGKKGYRTETRRILQQFVQHFEEKGWDSTYFEIFLNHKKDYRFFPYTIDEIWYDKDEEAVDLYWDIIKDIYETSHTKFIWRIDSSSHLQNHYDHRFADYHKFWVAAHTWINWLPEAIDKFRKDNSILWAYGSILQNLEEDLNHLFIWPIQGVIQGYDGFCLWNTTGFGNDALACGVNGGSELLFYPGNRFGIEAPLPSIRLKFMRNSMQFGDLLMMCKGTELQQPLEQHIHQAFGYTKRSDWFIDKPPYFAISPQHWDFDDLYNNHTVLPRHWGKPAEFANTLIQDLYKIMDSYKTEESTGAIFKFQ